MRNLIIILRNAFLVWLVSSAQFVTTISAEEQKPAKDFLEGLVIAPAGTLQLQTGKSLALKIGRFSDTTPVGGFEEVTLPVVWSIEPSEDVSLDRDSGILMAEDTIAGIKTFDVKASIANGQKTISKKLYVYNPLSVPLVGVWHEQSRIPCTEGASMDSFKPINELVFHANGTFSVTWIPFELYMDYWGDYTVDYKNNKLTLNVTGGNNIPKDISASGSFNFAKDGGFTLKEIYLGTGQNDTVGDKSCGYVFR